MSAFVIAELSIHDLKEMEEYKRITNLTIAAFNGRHVVNRAPALTLEGDWKPERIVVVEFPSVDEANKWWNSELYSKAKEIRQRSSTTKMIIVDCV
jgi:uncharacterized protein (DUF1330 family)